MLAALIWVVLAAIVLVLILLAVIVVGIRREPPRSELSDVAPSPFTAMIRRMLGLYVRRAAPSAVTADRHEHGSRDKSATQPRATT
jgi:hypothetical protein